GGSNNYDGRNPPIPDALTFTAIADDPDFGQKLTFSLDPGAPAGATIDPVTGEFTWPLPAGPGDGTFPVRVTDSGSPAQSAASTYRFHVLPRSVPPVINLPSDPGDSSSGSSTPLKPAVTVKSAQVVTTNGVSHLVVTFSGQMNPTTAINAAL